MSATPVCPACGAKFAHNAETLSCKKCGITDEILANPREVAVFKRTSGLVRTDVSNTTRRRRAHGRPRSRGRVKGGK